MTDGYKIKRILTWQGGAEKQIYPASRLPSAYQEVEYIKSSGTQYINTGYIPTIYDSIETKFKTESSSSDTNLYGSRDSVGLNYKDFTIWINTSSGKGIAVHYPYNSSAGGTTDTSWFFTSDIINTARVLKITPKYCYVDGVIKYTFNVSRTDYVGDWSAYIFGQNNKGTSTKLGKFTLYYFKIRYNTTLKREFVPCYRKSDSVIGMYDLVTNQFYTNSGRGTFTKGPDVS